GDAGVPPKKAKYVCECKSSWTEEFPYISNSHLDNSHAFCKACRIYFNIGHGGKNDVRQHIRDAEAQKGTQALSNYITKGQTEQEQVLKAELKSAMLVAKIILFSFCDEYSARFWGLVGHDERFRSE